MDPGGGSDPPPRRPNKGKKTMTDEPPKRRRNREVELNIGNMRSHNSFVGPPSTAPQPPPPSGPGWFHLPSHGHYTGPTAGYGAAAGYGAPPGHIGSSSGHIGPSAGLSMPTPEPQDDIQHDVGGGNVDADSSTDDERVEVIVINGIRLKVIYSSGNALLPAKVASSNITHVIRKRYFQKFHTKWSKVEEDDRNDLLDFFRTKVTWDTEDDDNVRRIFFRRMGAQISDLLYKLRCKDKKPSYMSDEIWNAFKNHWATEAFKETAAKAKNNRNSEKGGSLHCGGSINQAQHAARMSKKAGRPITAPELHRATHVRKGTGEYVDERSKMTQEQINEFMTQLTQGSWNPDSLGQLTPEMIDLANKHWEKTVGWSKGRLYGTGPMAPCMGQSGVESSRRRSRPASTPAETEHIRRLEQELHETRQEVRTSSEAMKKMQQDYEKVIRRQELMFKYFKNIQPNEQQQDAEEADEEDDEEAEESDGGSF